jgi:hypothetical protein
VRGGTSEPAVKRAGSSSYSLSPWLLSRLLREVKDGVADFERLLGLHCDLGFDALAVNVGAVFGAEVFEEEAVVLADEAAMFAGSFGVFNDDIALDATANDDGMTAAHTGQ